MEQLKVGCSDEALIISADTLCNYMYSYVTLNMIAAQVVILTCKLCTLTVLYYMYVE